MASGDRHRAVLVDVAGGTRFTAGVVPVARGNAAPLVGPERHAELRMRLGGLYGLHVADVVPGRAVRRLGTVFGAVDLAHFERVDAELARQLVDAAFDPERADRRARGPVGGNLGAIAKNVVADRLGVGQVVDRKSADAALLDRRTRKRPRLVFEHGLGSGDPAVLFGAHLDFDDGARGRPGRPENLFSVHHNLDGPTRLLRQHVGDRFQIDDSLAAKAAADLGGDRTDARIILSAGNPRS